VRPAFVSGVLAVSSMPALLRFFALRIKRLEPFSGWILALERD
jgi:hypothetical protein